MKILAVQPYGDGAGHFGKYTVRLCHEMGKLGHEVVLCTNLINPAEYLEETPAFRLEQLGPGYSFFPFEIKKSTSPLVWLFGRIRNNVAVLNHAVRLAERERFDIVQLFSYELVSTWLFLALRRPAALPPVVIEIAAANFSPEKYYGGHRERFWRRLQKLALKRMLGTYIQAICMNSASHVPELRRQLGLPEDFIVECVGDTREIPQTPLDKSEARKKIGLADYRGCVFLFFGTIRRDKGLETLLKAFGMLPAELECRLVIAGMPLDWSPSEEARRILSDPRVVTRFEYIPEQEIDAYFYASDALVLPYAGFYAGSSGPLYEAGARGLPVIVSDVSEMGRIARERNLGIVMPPDNAEALADAMKRFIKLDQAQKAQWSANALALVRENKRSTVARRFVSIYQKLFGKQQDVHKA
jgi:glycosyltransferase involved in cell wall biosynthesis